ncbi:hypothetical protein F5972_08445 [Microbispora cellulosiformans]|uniref:Uncharacterized protein n=1 Tax=Microbispora cellulosiformans TaxID=2614688 RepID=A0A5J5K4Z4_9ACTN|nr:hypothetical protein [Microbispora cellulosiformans]KAA9379671.1 hypothetical protein F5972_08445 [Microbispora cellulosiformans]
MSSEEPQPDGAEETSDILGVEVVRQGGRTVRDAISDWSKAARLGVLLLFAAGAIAVYHWATSSSQEEPPQCRIDIVLPAPAKAGGELHI